MKVIVTADHGMTNDGNHGGNTIRRSTCADVCCYQS